MPLATKDVESAVVMDAPSALKGEGEGGGREGAGWIEEGGLGRPGEGVGVAQTDPLMVLLKAEERG